MHTYKGKVEQSTLVHVEVGFDPLGLSLRMLSQRCINPRQIHLGDVQAAKVAACTGRDKVF